MSILEIPYQKVHEVTTNFLEKKYYLRINLKLLNHPFPRVDKVCKAEDCLSVDIKNGNSSPKEIKPGGVMTIECDTNYTISTKDTITCKSTTLFSPAVLPTCLGEKPLQLCH